MRQDIADIVCNIFNRDKTPGEQAGEPVWNGQREGTIFGSNTRRMAELKRMIAIQEKLVIRMINGDEEEFIPPQPRKPRLRTVK